MSHFIGGPMQGALVPNKLQSDYRIMVGPVHYIRRMANCGRVDFAIYGMLDAYVEKLLTDIYSTEDV